MRRFAKTYILITLIVLCIFGISSAYADRLIKGKKYKMDGKIHELIVDYSKETSKTIFQFQRDGQKEKIDLRFLKGVPAKLQGGDRVQLTGSAINASTLRVEKVMTQEPMLTAAAMTGTRSVGVVQVHFSDKLNPCSISQIQSAHFGTGTSVNEVYKQSSFGLFGITGSVIGPVTINYLSTGSCDYSGWAAAANTALKAQGVDITKFNHIEYSIPSASACGWSGLAYRPGTQSWVMGCSVGVAAHELGHNFGMSHASSGTATTVASEYGDKSDFMGGAGAKHNNISHKGQMGWIPSTVIKEIKGNESVRIAPLEISPDLAAAGGLFQMVKIVKPDTAENYYLSLRKGIGFDSGLTTTYLERLNIHRFGTIKPVFVTSLGLGEVYTDSINGMSITVTNKDTDSITADISFGCSAAAPTFTISPASQATIAGVDKTYSLSLKNNDSMGCSASTFNLVPTVPSGVNSSLSSSSMTLAAGASGTVSLVLNAVSGSADGTYSFQVGASDSSAVSHTAAVTGSLVISSKVPASPVLSGNSPRKRKVNLSWSAVSNGNGTMQYLVFENGVQVATTSSLSLTRNAASKSVQRYKVVAKDGLGLESLPSNEVVITVQ